MDKLISTLPEAEALTLTEQISYVPGAAECITLTHIPNVFIKLFAFDEGTGLPEHGGPGQALINILEGEAEFDIEGKKVRVKQGESLVMPANAPHSVRAVSKFKMLLTVVGED